MLRFVFRWVLPLILVVIAVRLANSLSNVTSTLIGCCVVLADIVGYLEGMLFRKPQQAV